MKDKTQQNGKNKSEQQNAAASSMTSGATASVSPADDTRIYELKRKKKQKPEYDF